MAGLHVVQRLSVCMDIKIHSLFYARATGGISHRSDSACNFHDSHFYNRYTGDLLLMLLVFFTVFLLVRYTRIYKFRICNFLLLIALPIVIYGARITGEEVYGSYLEFAGMMIFGLVLMGFPFAAASVLANISANWN